MKTFALLFATAFVSAKDLPSMDMIPAMDDGPEIVYPSEEEIWQSTKDMYFYEKSVWNGVFQGLYGASSSV